MAAFVVLLVAVWGLGFMWVRGDLDPSADKVSASNADAKESASPSASPSASATPSEQPSVEPSAKPKRSSRP